MPPKPTCKVVKREGQRGARIDPKGCKVRTTKDAQGNKRQYNKQGQEKFKITEIKDEAAARQDELGGPRGWRWRGPPRVVSQ